MSRFVSILLLAVLAVVGMNVGPAHAATPPVGYGGAAYAPWTEDIQTGKGSGNGLCLSYDDVRLRLVDASRQVVRTYPSAEVSKPDPRAVAMYRAAKDQLAQDLQGMSADCQVALYWQVRTVATHLWLRDRQIFVTKDGRHTLIVAGPIPPDGWEPAQESGGGGCTACVEAVARDAQRAAQEGCGGCGADRFWGAAMQALGGIYTVGGVALSALAQVFPDRQQMLASLGALFGSIGVTMMAIPGIIDFLQRIYEGTGSIGGRNDGGDTCCCGCSH